MRPTDTDSDTRSTSMEALHSLADVRRILGVSRPTVHRLVRRGDLPVIKVGSRTLIEPADLRDYLAAKKRRRGQHDDGPAANAPDNPPRSPR
jgi:excisionase family DNA binding protein